MRLGLWQSWPEGEIEVQAGLFLLRPLSLACGWLPSLPSPDLASVSVVRTLVIFGDRRLNEISKGILPEYTSPWRTYVVMNTGG